VVHLTQIISTTLRTRTEMVFQTLVSTKLNHLTRFITRENFIILTRRESIKSYILLLLLIAQNMLDCNIFISFPFLKERFSEYQLLLCISEAKTACQCKVNLTGLISDSSMLMNQDYFHLSPVPVHACTEFDFCDILP
jgi:hypothetical protein